MSVRQLMLHRPPESKRVVNLVVAIGGLGDEEAPVGDHSVAPRVQQRATLRWCLSLRRLEPHQFISEQQLQNRPCGRLLRIGRTDNPGLCSYVANVHVSGS